MNVLETNGLTKRYKKQNAVAGVNMHIAEGDIYGFVGENGAGKTTLIRLITGLARPTGGSYSLFGVPDSDKGIYEARKKTGAIVEAAVTNAGMTALDNLRMQCFVTGVEKTDEELEELLSRVGLDPVAVRKKKTGNFSLGMKQRLAIASLMISDPKFVILDEPMNGLDPQGFVEVREIILKLHNEGVTFLISSHILSELQRICNKIGIISHGVLLEETTMEDLHSHSGRRIIVETEETERLASLLRERLGLLSVTVQGNSVKIADDTDLNGILKLVVEEGIPVRSVNTPEETMEDYYLRVLQGGAKR